MKNTYAYLVNKFRMLTGKDIKVNIDNITKEAVYILIQDDLRLESYGDQEIWVESPSLKYGVRFIFNKETSCYEYANIVEKEG